MPVRPFYYTPDTFKKFFTWWWILLAVGAVTSIILIGIPVLIAAYVLWFMFMFKCWNQIQDGYQKTTPGKAIGFLFIPFFNLYWQFVAIHGLAQNLNAYGERHGIAFPRVAEGLALTYCILVLCCIVPLLNYLIPFALIVIIIILTNQFKAASMAIAASQTPSS